MAKNRFQVGQAVRARKDHGHVRRGMVGHVTEVRQGFYYGVAWPGVGPSYSPEENVSDKDVDDSLDVDIDDNGGSSGSSGTAPAPAATSSLNASLNASVWQRLMALVSPAE